MISFETYFRRLVSVHQEIELAQNALGTLQEAPEVVEKFKRSELAAWQTHTDALSKEVASRGFAAEHLRVMSELLSSELPTRLGELGMRLRQQGLILRIAVYEAFMKDVHRAALKAKPTLLKSDRTVTLGALAAKGLDQVLQDEIDREVRTLDRGEHGKEGQVLQGKAWSRMDRSVVRGRARKSYDNQKPDSSRESRSERLKR
jgi:hypothetical protein